jgi:flagellar operon protein
MALDRVATGMPGINPSQGTDGLKKGPQGLGSLQGDDFRRALEQVMPSGQTANAQALKAPQGVTGSEKLKFSAHSVERMHSRGISFAPDEMTRIENAVTKAAAKGSKDALILSGDKALIVSVKNNTVVTVMDRAAMKDNVFTNIDSTVVL